MSETCVFCSIVTSDLQADVVHSDDDFLAFRDMHPRAATHVLVIPRVHHDHLDAWIVSGGSSDAMLGFVRACAIELGIAGGYRLVTNVGEEAGQVVPHLHWHLMAGGRLPGY